MQEVAGVEYLEEELVTLLAILAHQRGEVLHGRSLYLLEAVEGVHLTDGVEDIVTLGHLHRGEVTRALWY